MFQSSDFAGKYNLDIAAPATAVDTPLHNAAGPSADDSAGSKPWHPSNPMMVLGVIMAATFGLMAASVSGRVGPVHASAGIGK